MTPACAGCIAPPEQPWQQLPIAPRPAVQAGRGDIVPVREFLDDLDIGRESRACVDAFEQVVAQQRTVGRATGERRLEGVDVVDTLAGIGPFAEEVLVHVGNGGGIRIEAGRTRNDSLKERALAPRGKRRRDARLQHRIALDHATGDCIESRAIQGVGQFPDQSSRRATRQPRVGIERDHVAHVGRHAVRELVCSDEARVGCAPQESIQFVKLAALSLPAHPPTLGGAP